MDLYRLSLRALPHKRLILAASFLAGFGVAGMLFVLAGVLSFGTALSYHVDHQLHSLDELTDKWIATLERLEQVDESEACSADFMQALHEIAFLPDGVHEFLYAPDGIVVCSATQHNPKQTIDIGSPDFSIRDGKINVWRDGDFAKLAAPLPVAKLIGSGSFVMVVTPPDPLPTVNSWIEAKLSFNRDDLPGHRASLLHERSFGLYRHDCDANGIFCVEGSVSLVDALAERVPGEILGLALALLCGIASMHIVDTRLDRFWAFPTRFRKLMNAESVHCVYQPILTLSNDRIDAIEVLARWRDTTGETVMPGDFLPIVEDARMTRAFTEVLVRNVLADLEALPRRDGPMRVHFNIYPEDFDADWLLLVFAPLLALGDRFVVVVEILERQQSSLDQLRDAIATLRENGILTYVDDFGAGFSNIQMLGHVPLEGVKLDRSFGQAAEGSLMAGLQVSASDLIDKTGYKVLVEGVETRERLESLRQGGVVDQAQGYHIARPMAFDALVAFLDEHAGQMADPAAEPVKAKQRRAV